MSALFMAMILTGAGGLADAQGSGKPMPVPVPYISPPAPIAVPPPPALAQRSISDPPSPLVAVLLRDNFADYFTPEDYPDGALQPYAYGGVFFRLEIGPDGRVTRCTVTGGSAPPALGQATCRILADRARYRPALDAAGRPTRGIDEGRVVWQAPGTAGEPAQIRVPPSAPAPPPPPRFVPPQRARANLNSYFSVDDYPALALRANHQGTTAFRLTIGTDGRVAACEVTSSSNSEPLDQATCRIIRSRARYVAARDENGAPTTGIDSGRVTWRLPGDDIPDRAGVPQAYRPARWLSGSIHEVTAADYPPGAPPPSANDNKSGFHIVIGPEGRVIACETTDSSGSPALDAAACRLYAERVRFEPARDQTGRAICDFDWASVDWGPAAAARAPAPRGARSPSARPMRPLRQQLNAALCPGWPVAASVPPPLALPVPVPVPVPLAPPLPVAQQPVLLRGAPFCFPETGTPPFIFESCFHVGDYPMEAYFAREQGVVGVRMTIGSLRAESRCEVTVSSGSAELDSQTCAMLVRRALATEGRRMAAGQVAWVLPSSPPVDTRSSLQTYFSADDYPAAALRANAQGTVTFLLDVGANGRAIDCQVTGSSGEESLDTATCRILRSRARFQPAQDALGRAVPGTWSGRLNWRLPSE